MSFDYAAAVASAASQVDMNKASTGGGEGYQPPAKGMTRLRFVGYIECGKHKDEWQGQVKIKEKVKLIFELSGPKHPPREVDGKKIPHRLTIHENLSLNEKAWFYKIFKAMNYAGEATHIAQLLGQEFLGEVIHKTSKKGNVYPTLKGDAGYTIRAPYVEDPETGETRKVPAGPQLSEIRCFLWDFASKEMWDSIYIEGQYDEERDSEGNVVRAAKSKNVFQDQIRAAVNFAGSPIDEILSGGALGFGEEASPGEEVSAPQQSPEATSPAEEPAAETDEDDPLVGVS